jgi:hypothetical protein
VRPGPSGSWAATDPTILTILTILVEAVPGTRAANSDHQVEIGREASISLPSTC